MILSEMKIFHIPIEYERLYKMKYNSVCCGFPCSNGDQMIQKILGVVVVVFLFHHLTDSLILIQLIILLKGDDDSWNVHCKD